LTVLLNLNRTYLLLLCLFIFSHITSIAQNITNEIRGTIKLDSTWSPKIYLSHIPAFGKMHTMSKSMIIAETNIDDNGYFHFNTNYLPKEDNLYRIHVSKKNASPASLIIGGKDENHFFIVANKNSHIEIMGNEGGVNSISIDDEQNKIIRRIDDIVKYIDSTNFNESRMKSEFVTKAFNEQIRKIADTCSYPLASLYALHKSKFETDISNNIAFYYDFLNKWSKEDSNYFIEFQKKIPTRKGPINNRIIIGIVIIISFLLGFFLNKALSKNTKVKTKLLKSLSVQERKIFLLLKEGKSNKEISDECNIGLSTVKSHISSIYSKLNVKSRKEVLDIE